MSSAPKSNARSAEDLERFLKSDNGQRLSVCVFSLVATLVLVVFPGEIIAVLLGVPFLFFIPGFAVVRLFFWKNTTTEAKFVLSMGLSIIVVIILGLVLVMTPIGLNSDTTRGSLAVFSIAAVALEAFVLPVGRGEEGAPVRVKQKPKPMKMDKVVASMLGAALVVSAISLGLIVTAEYPPRTFFAITDEDGMVIQNTTFGLGTNLTVILHMKNDEGGPRNFTVTGYGLNTVGFGSFTHSRTLQDGEEWNQTMTFNLTVEGYMRLDFDLYIQKVPEPPVKYGNLHLWIRIMA